jgi:hypothetical protein
MSSPVFSTAVVQFKWDYEKDLSLALEMTATQSTIRALIILTKLLQRQF